ncbi:unnamed protein product [Rangifer tarandus platyrhynchus]|uniref:Uncharacterized protein n=2 Tax=Rangifer tarandus platyrhynchus TaxID=3082113 RepID=A0AC59Z7W6_RANTA
MIANECTQVQADPKGGRIFAAPLCGPDSGAGLGIAGVPSPSRPGSESAALGRALRLEPGGGPRVDPPAPPQAGAEAPPRANRPPTTPVARPHPPPPQPPASSAAPAPAPPPPAWSAPSPARAGPLRLPGGASRLALPSSPTALSRSLPALPSGEESSTERIDSSALCGRPAPNSSVRSELDFPRRRPRRRRHSGGGGGGGGSGGGGGASVSTPGPRHFGLGASAAQGLKAAAGARGSAAPSRVPDGSPPPRMGCDIAVATKEEVEVGMVVKEQVANTLQRKAWTSCKGKS